MILNQIKTIILLALLSGIFLFVGGLVGGSTGIHIALIVALLFNGLVYFFSDRLVLKLYRAQPLDHNQYQWVYEMVEELRQSMQLPIPTLWLINTPMANAFATGRNPHHASIAITTGVLSILDRDELRGVLAHELAHVQNRDILVSTVAATIATAIGYLASMLRNMIWWGTAFASRRRDNGNPIGLFIVALLMPIAATLIQLAISRSREYLADETGAHACKDPLALASALEKLNNHRAHAHLNPNDTQHASTASLFIVNPFTTGSLMTLFSTHPPMQQRVERLRRLFEKYFS